MQRKAFKMFLLPGFEAEYARRHDLIWPELVDLLHQVGNRNYSIFLDADTLTLFAYLEAPDLNALDHHVDRLQEDHARAKEIAKICARLPWVDSILPVTTNIVIIQLKEGIRSVDQVAQLKAQGIFCAPFGPQYIRFVTHLNFDDVALAAFKAQLNK